MLTVILNILKILGIILLVILGVLLTAILLVLFYPICYKIDADRRPNSQKTDADGATSETVLEYINRADVKAWWLFGLLRARFCYPEPGKLKVKLLFFTIYESEMVGEPVEEEQTDTTSDDVIPSTEEQSDKSIAATSTDTAKNTNYAASKQNVDPKLNPIEKIQYTFRKFYDKIKEVRENIAYYKEVLLCDETKELLKYAFMRLGKIVKSIRPRKLRADIRFGTGAPDTTGYAFAVYGMICPHLSKEVYVTPDFEQAILIGELHAKGHITIFKVLWNGLMIVKDHRLWELKDKLTKNK